MQRLFSLLLIPLWSAAAARNQAAREATLLWSLAIGLERQFSLELYLQAIAADASGGWRRKLLGLAQLLAADMSLPEALEAHPG
ncbi:MAG: hypothetical protein JSS02_29565, partial [Planctomycetes bacterium]|nr:hypothetical protein [Planctomycetota bacterium]